MVIFDDHIPGTDMPRSRQRDLGWCGKCSTGQASVCDECCCTARNARKFNHISPLFQDLHLISYDCHRRSSLPSLCSPSFACTVCLRRRIASAWPYHFNCLIMTALIGQAIYIFILWFLLLLLFPRLTSAVGDWMSTILRHMVWP